MCPGSKQVKVLVLVSHPSIPGHIPPSTLVESLGRGQREQPVKQNGSLCSVIAGNLALVSLATQTWFVAVEEERLQSSRSNGDSRRAALLAEFSSPIIPGKAEAVRAESQSAHTLTQTRANPTVASLCVKLQSNSTSHLTRTSQYPPLRLHFYVQQEASEGARPPPSAVQRCSDLKQREIETHIRGKWFAGRLRKCFMAAEEMMIQDACEIFKNALRFQRGFQDECY